MLMRGALVGLSVLLGVGLARAIFVLVPLGLAGHFSREFPYCDPCGFTGYAGRMLIVTAMFVGTFSVPAAVAGWLVERVWLRRRRT